MFLSKDGVNDKIAQYECRNITQVKNVINKITKTISINNDWKDFCYQVKKHGGCDSCDYIYFENNEEKDCTVCIGYDKNNYVYLVWIEV